MTTNKEKTNKGKQHFYTEEELEFIAYQTDFELWEQGQLEWVELIQKWTHFENLKKAIK